MRRLLFLVCLLVLLLAPQGEAVGVEKLHQRRHKQTQTQESMAPVPAPAAAPSSPPSLTSESLLEQTSGDSTEILNSLKQLIQQKKASSVSAHEKLAAAAAHTLQVEAALAAKHAELEQHNIMLAQLEQCLSQGPATQRASAAEVEFKQQETALVEARAGVEERAQQLAEHAEELEQQRDALEQSQQELEEREHLLKQTRAHLTQQQSLLETQAKEVDHKEKQLEAIIKARVEKIVGEKLAAVRAEVESQASERLSAVKHAMASQAQELLKEQETALMEERAAKIAQTHQMRDLTSVDENPYLHLAEAGEQGQLEQEQEGDEEIEV